MNLNQLQYFISVAENLNFTKAAEKCFISQTAMTKQIRALEKTVGVPLFIRDKHHVELTAAGRVYLNEARIILSHNNEALRLARLVSEGVEGELTIGYIHGLAQSDFAEPLRKFHKSYPKVDLHLFGSNMSVLLDRLNRKECDLVVTVAPLRREHTGIKYKYLKSYPLSVMLPAGHSLAGKKELTYSDLKHEDFIMMEPTDRPQDQLDESILIYSRAGYIPNVVGMEGNPETLVLLIAVGLGISILPEYVVRPYKDNKDLKIIPLVKEDGLTETLDLEVDWLEDNANPALEHMLESLKM